MLGFLGETPEIKIIDFLAENMDIDYNQTEISEFTGLSRTTVNKKIPELIYNNIIEKKGRIGQTEVYQLADNEIVKNLISASLHFSFIMPRNKKIDLGTYNDALYKLNRYEIIIITGKAQVGKTTLALELAHRIKSVKGLDRILLDRYGKTGIENFKGVKNSVIIFDDALGKTSDEKYSDYAHNTHQVMELKANPSNNYIIMTIDSQILERIKNDRTRFGEYLGNIEIVKLNKNEEV
ncbi:MAG: hypothetical protein SVK08_01270 [Halobacteriota archaeon]|nr:hypothetical protein [Halobacteriota archaeon]